MPMPPNTTVVLKNLYSRSFGKASKIKFQGNEKETLVDVFLWILKGNEKSQYNSQIQVDANKSITLPNALLYVLFLVIICLFPI